MGRRAACTSSLAPIAYSAMRDVASKPGCLIWQVRSRTEARDSTADARRAPSLICQLSTTKQTGCATVSHALSLLEGLPELLVALRRPHPRIAVPRRLVEGARDVERKAMVEDDPGAEARPERGVGFLVNRSQVSACGCAPLHRAEHRGDEFARSVEPLLHRLSGLQ